jgi:hypothetical protein
VTAMDGASFCYVLVVSSLVYSTTHGLTRTPFFILFLIIQLYLL